MRLRAGPDSCKKALVTASGQKVMRLAQLGDPVGTGLAVLRSTSVIRAKYLVLTYMIVPNFRTPKGRWL